jgi:VWFA-related protein
MPRQTSLTLPCILGAVSLLFGVRSSAQSPASSPPETSPTLTLQAGARIVLTDVIVKDRDGNPVHGLPASDFRIFDDNHPQAIASFDEHTDVARTSIASPATPSPIFSNESTLHLPPVLNVVVLDTTNLELPDQMYLSFQLAKFVKSLPTGQPIAVFERHGDNAVMLQNFTADHALLLAAIRRALPRIIMTGRAYRSDTDTLHQIGSYLSQIPGRKNVLWFSGGSTFFLLDGLAALGSGAAPSAAGLSEDPSTNSPAESIGALRQVYDELEASRIAIYPIDARGLKVDGGVAMGPQQTQMNDVAQATGGQAFFNMDGLARIADHIVSTDSSAYTISYSPRNFHYDNKWHTVKVTVEGGPYTLSYRRGYFADTPHTIVPGTDNPHPLTLAGDTTPTATPDTRSAPIIFQATVHPTANVASATSFIPLRPQAPAPKGTSAFAIDYSLSTSALTSAPVDGAPRASVAFAVIAFDSNGDEVAQSLDRVRFPLQPDSPPKRLNVEQQIDLRPEKSGVFLSLIVWDTVSGRLGTLEIPLSMPATTSAKITH